MNYLMIYTKLMERSKGRTLDCYTEKHQSRIKMSESSKGKTHSLETREKMSASSKLRWEKRKAMSL